MSNLFQNTASVFQAIVLMLLILITLIWPIRKRLSGRPSRLFYFFIIATLIKEAVQIPTARSDIFAQELFILLPLTLEGFLLSNYLIHRLRPQFQSLLNYILTAFFSAAVTLYCCGHTETAVAAINFFLLPVTGILAVFALGNLFNTGRADFFENALFWIATGTAFYAFIYLLMGLLLLSGCYDKAGESAFALLMLFFNSIRFVLYLIAAAMREKDQPAAE